MRAIISDQLPVAVFIAACTLPFAPVINFFGEKLLGWSFDPEKLFLVWIYLMVFATVLMVIAEGPRLRKR